MASRVPGYGSTAEPTEEFTALFERFLESSPARVLPDIDGNYVQPSRQEKS